MRKLTTTCSRIFSNILLIGRGPRGANGCKHFPRADYCGACELEVAQFPKFRNHELWFLLPVRNMRNWESENNSFLIPFTIPLLQIPVTIPQKKPTEPELRFLGIRIVPPLMWMKWILTSNAGEVISGPEFLALQPADIGLATGNGKKLSCSQAHLGQAKGLAVA